MRATRRIVKTQGEGYWAGVDVIRSKSAGMALLRSVAARDEPSRVGEHAAEGCGLVNKPAKE